MTLSLFEYYNNEGFTCQFFLVKDSAEIVTGCQNVDYCKTVRIFTCIFDRFMIFLQRI